MALLNFDATTVAPDVGFEVVPPGWYNVMMVESEVKPTKAEGGLILNCQYKIVEGQYAGRILFGRYNIRNANPVAQEIGYKQLSAVCHAVGVLQVQDSQLLHGKPLKVKVKIRVGNKDPQKGEVYEDQNEITTYRNINDNVEAGSGGPTAVAAHAASLPSTGFAAQPWANPTAGASAPAAQPFPLPTVSPAPAVVPPPVTAPPPTAAPVALPQVKTMTAKAQGATYEQFIGSGWTDDKMVAEGYLTLTAPVAPPVQAPPLAVPSVPAVGPVAPVVPGVAAAPALVPPWMQK